MGTGFFSWPCPLVGPCWIFFFSSHLSILPLSKTKSPTVTVEDPTDPRRARKGSDHQQNAVICVGHSSQKCAAKCRLLHFTSEWKNVHWQNATTTKKNLPEVFPTRRLRQNAAFIIQSRMTAGFLSRAPAAAEEKVADLKMCSVGYHACIFMVNHWNLPPKRAGPLWGHCET